MTVQDNTIRNRIVINTDGDSEIKQLLRSINAVEASLRDLGVQQGALAVKSAAAAGSTRLFARGFDDLNRSAKAFVSFELSRAASNLVGGFFRAVIEGERLEAQLLNITGSAQEARRNIENLSNLSFTLPIGGANELVAIYSRLENLNLDNSNAAITDLADLSAGLGRELPRVVEAIADASVFEFERLREEFGIIARQTDENIRFTFQGVTTEVEKSASAVQAFLRDLGRENFGGAAADQLNTLGGAVGEFTNTLSQAAKVIDERFELSENLATFIRELSRLGREKAGIETVRDLNIQMGIAGSEISESNRLLEIHDGLLKDLSRLDPRRLLVLIAQNEQLNRQTEAIERQAQVSAELARVQTTGLYSEFAQTRIKAYSSSVDQLIGKNDQLLLGVSEYVSGLGKQTTELQKVEQAIKNIELFGENSDINADLSERLALLKDWRTTILEAGAAAEKVANDNQAQSALDSIFSKTTSTFDAAVQAYRANIELVRSEQSLPEAILEKNNVNRGQLETALRNNLVETIRSGIGPLVIRGATAESIAAYEEQQRLITQAIKQGAEGRQAVADLERDQIVRNARNLTAAISATQAANDPFFKFEQEFLARREKFGIDLDGTTQETKRKFAEYQQTLNSGFIDDLDIDLPAFTNVAAGIDAIDASIQKLNASQVAFSDDQKLEARIALLQQLFDQAAENTTGTSVLQAIIKEYEELGGAATGFLLKTEEEEKRSNARRFGNAQQLTRQLLNLSDEELTKEKFSARQKALIAGTAASQVLGIFAENSEKIFNIQKALDATLIASQAATAIGAAIRNAIAASGPLGILKAGVEAAAVAAKYAALISEVSNREFGDSSIGTDGNISSSQVTDVRASQSELSGGNSGSAVINVYGNLLDGTSFRQEVVRTVKEAGGRDELSIEDFTVRNL